MHPKPVPLAELSLLAFADPDSMTQFWRCFKRTGLPEKDALALLGFHPFAAGWADPQAAEQSSGAEQLRFSNAFFRWGQGVPDLFHGVKGSLL